MKRSPAVLFWLRLFFYFSVTGLVLFHPGIPVSFDHTGLLQWFAIIPLAALFAFFPIRKNNPIKRSVVTLAFLVPLSIWAGGFNIGALQPFCAGIVSFILTFLLFHHPRWAKASALEPFFLAWVCLRLLALSRSGEDIAGQSMGYTQFVFVWTAVVFLLHSAVIYLCLYPGSRGAGKEGLVFALAALAALVVVIFILPADFVRNTVINNLLPDRVPEKINQSADKGIPHDGGRKNGRRTLPDNGKDRQPGLRGISEYNWPGRGGQGGGEGETRQYMVMVVASKQEPVYMGDSYRGRLDPTEGFLVSREEPLNDLPSRRFFVTWFNNEWNFDLGRTRQEVSSLSTLREKYLPYIPAAIDPTILSEDTGPLRYIHQVVSDTHTGDPLELVHTLSRPLSGRERSNLAPYLELPLEQGDLEAFDSYLKQIMEKWKNNRNGIIQSDSYLEYIFSLGPAMEETGNEYLETITAILSSFSRYRYNLNYDDDSSIAALKEFLFENEEGDCIEFSNSAALLGRIAGIPSRVVTGYLAAESLQTVAHLRGLATLRGKIPFLQQFPFEDLYMVTNVHRHSWAQFYIPDYGWLDFETTSFAIPPLGTGDFNTWDVVIPLLDENRVFSQVRKFPWQAVLRAVLILAALALLCAYALRYGREAVLYFGTRRGGRNGARSLYLLLLARLAADGKPIKPASKTALEYAELFPGAPPDSPLAAFAALYTELRWKEFGEDAERDKRFLMLREEYQNILKTTRWRGTLRTIVRIFSLRGLAYL